VALENYGLTILTEKLTDVSLSPFLSSLTLSALNPDITIKILFPVSLAFGRLQPSGRYQPSKDQAQTALFKDPVRTVL
jgi:hypothetical protein